MRDVPSSGSKRQSAEVPFAGREIGPTLRWAAVVLQRAPLLIVVALAVSSVEIFLAEGNPVRILVSMLGSLLVTALAAVLAEDTVEERDRTDIEQIRVAVGALPRLVIVFLLFLVLVFVGVLVPILLVRFLGVVIALAVTIYLIALFQIVFPAVVLDESFGRGRGVFSEAKFLAFGLVVVFAIGRAPISLFSPTPADPVLAVPLVVWAALVTALSGIAYSKVYIAHR